MDDLFFDGEIFYPALSAGGEPNDTLATAEALSEGSHSMVGEGVDYYSFEAQAGRLTVTMTPDTASEDYNLVLMNSAGAVIANSPTASGAESITRDLSVAGTYYLRVFKAQFGLTPPAGTVINYTLDLDLPQVVAADGNNTLETATALAEGSHDILGREVDWHQLDATAGYMTLTMTQKELLDDANDTRDDARDLNLVLVNSAGQIVKSSPSTGSTESFTYLIPEDGTYYARVMTAQFGTSAPDGTVLSYSLDVDYADPIASDGNDSMATASTLTEGTHAISGTGQDWFRLDTVSGLISVSFTPDSATWPDGSTTDLNMVLFNSAGVAVKSAPVAGGGESFTYLAGQDGTYYLRIFNAARPAGVENVALEYSLTVDLPETAASDGNDTFETAATLTEGTHSRTGTGVDWYKFDTVSGVMNFSMTQTAATAPDGSAMNLNIDVYDSTGAVRATNHSGDATKALSTLAGADGTFYLKIYWDAFPNGAPNGVQMAYDLTVDLPEVGASDGNDTFETAADITEGAHSLTGSRVDWYKFETLTGMMTFNLTQTGNTPAGEEMPLNIEVYDSNGDVRATNHSADTSKTLSELAGQAGTFYLKVYWAPYPNGAPNGVEMAYDLTIDLPEAATSDGNDTFETAGQITEGTHSLTGTGVDWYKFDTVSGLMNFTLTQTGNTPAGAEMPLNIEVYDSNGDVRATATDEITTKTLTALAGVDGTFYLKVYWAPYPNGAPNGVQMAYDLTVDLPEVGASDGNDSFETATLLTEGTHDLGGSIVDWYKFDTLSGMMNFTLTQKGQTPGGEEMPLNIEVYDSTGEVRATSTDEITTKTLTALAGSDGTFYLKIYWAPYPDGGPNGVQMSYDLTVDLPEATVPGPDDPGESRATATQLTEGTHTFTGTGRDWFRIDSGPGQMDFTMRHLGGVGPNGQELDLNMELYSESGELLRGEFEVLADETFSLVGHYEGTYYLRIYWDAYPNGVPNGFEMNYTLEVDLPDNSWATVLDFGPIRNSSVAVYDIDKDGKDEIFIGASKALDDEGNEILPGGLIVLEDDGSVKWTTTFDAYDTPDPKTGLIYNTTSVSTQAVFSDVNGDGNIDIVVGVGADNRAEFQAPGQPGDKGGVYAVDSSGNILWYYQTKDVFGADSGGDNDGPDGRSDGVYGTPRVFDIDGDGVREVIFTSWDHRLYVLDGRTGIEERSYDLHDTTSTTPAVADLNGDGVFELVVAADITNNERAGIPDQGGILHAFSNYLQANVDGWTSQVGTSTNADFRGKFDEQPLWSDPQIADLNGDGTSEIIVGTSNFFLDERGQYIKVWNADGTLRNTLTTIGQPLAAPLIADLDGNGTLEIVAVTIKGHVQAWSSSGQPLFDVLATPFYDEALTGAAAELPIARTAIAVDLDSADNDLEILVTVGSQIVVFDSDGTQLTSLTQTDMLFNTFSGAPAAKDIDDDGEIDIISGGTIEGGGQAVVFRWENPFEVSVTEDTRTAIYQDKQSLHNIQDFVGRFYSTILGRAADPGGSNDWTDKLYTGVRSGADVARGFIFSQEFISQGTTNEEYVNTLYAAFFGRPADSGGFDGWMKRFGNGATRAEVLDGFIGSQEFINLANSYGIRASSTSNAYSDAALITSGDDTYEPSVLRGGAGNSTLVDEGTTVTEVANVDEANAGRVFRLYQATLGRSPDSGGFMSWFNALSDGRVSLATASGGFVGSQEFQNTYGSLSDADFVELLYQNVLGRASDPGGRTTWLNKIAQGLEDGGTVAAVRAGVVLGFSESQEFINRTNSDLDHFMRNADAKWIDVIEGGAGDDTMNGGHGGDIFVFRSTAVGTDVIEGFEPWDQLQLSGFGFRTAADAIAHMSQVGADVLFSFGGQNITFRNTTLSEMSRVRYNLS